MSPLARRRQALERKVANGTWLSPAEARDLLIDLDIMESCARSHGDKQPFCAHENRYAFTDDGGKTITCVMKGFARSSGKSGCRCCRQITDRSYWWTRLWRTLKHWWKCAWREILAGFRLGRRWIHYGWMLHVAICVIVGAVEGLLERR